MQIEQSDVWPHYRAAAILSTISPVCIWSDLLAFVRTRWALFSLSVETKSRAVRATQQQDAAPPFWLLPIFMVTLTLIWNSILEIVNQALVKFWLLMDQTSIDLKNIIVEWVALLRVSHVFQVEMAEACPFWPMIRVRSGWISREEAGLKAHDEVKRASSRQQQRRINANAASYLCTVLPSRMEQGPHHDRWWPRHTKQCWCFFRQFLKD